MKKHWKMWAMLFVMGLLLLLGAFVDVSLGPEPSWFVVAAQMMVIIGGSLLAIRFGRESGMPGFRW